MLTPSQSPEPVPEPNSSTPTTIRKKPTVEELHNDFPSFIQHRSANPLAKHPSHPLSNPGLALKRLGLTEKDIKGVPKITPRVKEALGSVKKAVELLRGDDAPDSIAFIAKWDSLSERDQKNIALEYVIVAAKLTTRRFMELLAGAEYDHSATVSKIFVSQSQLKVLKSTVKAATDSQPIFNKNGEIVAQSNGDVRAMEIFHKITGALPTPKPSSFILNKQININPSLEPVQSQAPLQAMDSFLMEIEDVRKPKQLEARNEPVIPVEMPENAPEIEYLNIEE